MAYQAIPTPRAILTSIIQSLPSPAPAESGATQAGIQHPPSNALEELPVAARPLLTTLHVLFPGILLPALDLLDRGLVTRVLLKDEHTRPVVVQNHTLPFSAARDAALTPLDDDESTTAILPQVHVPSDADLPGVNVQEHVPRATTSPDKINERLGFYIVRSAQESHSRSRSRHADFLSSSGSSYIVRLEAWNCSCAAFAFSAFPSGPSSSAGQTRPVDGHAGVNSTKLSRDGIQVGKAGYECGKDAWSFGGLSRHGQDGVPCCKHLLACVLAEKWHAVLGKYVKERLVGREEMAGLGADG